MKVFFDCEFTGLHQHTTLISIGLVDEYGRKFYAEFNDYDETQIDPWLEKNVVSKLLYSKGDHDFTTPTWFYWGNKAFIRQQLLKWLYQEREIEFVSDVCHYDFVLLIDLLFDNALCLPHGYSAACYDINQDIAKFYKCSTQTAFNLSRESIAGKIDCNFKQHNALYDAYLIKAVYEKLNKGSESE